METNTNTLQEKARTLAGDGRATLADAADLAQTGLTETRRRLVALAQRAKQTCTRLEEKTAQSAKAADQTVRNHPYETIAIGFGMGVVLGVLLTGGRATHFKSHIN
jgi:ElaB/YqjD/DUF883 family membrane-anchored ribosome-binding protein